jgi:hypothetical protein
MTRCPDVLLLSSSPGITGMFRHFGQGVDVSLREMGPYQLAGHVRQHGYTCQVISFLLEFSQQELQKLLDTFIGPNTVVGVSYTFPDDNKLPFFKQLIEYVRQHWPTNKIVIGGNSVFNTGIIFDAYFTGYSEQAFVEWLDQQRGKTSKRLYPVQKCGEHVDGDHSIHKFNIEMLQHQWHDNDCVVPGEALPIEISRGCIFSCKFCTYRHTGKKKFDYLRDPELIYEEMVDNYNRYGTTRYTFLDDTFNDSTYKLERLAEVFKKLPFKLEFWTYLRLDLLHRFPEQIPMLREMGLRDAFFGIESLNYESAKSIGKGLDTNKVKELLHDLYHTHWPDVHMTCSMIVGLPYETEDSVTEAMQWLKQYPRIYTGLHALSLIYDIDAMSSLSKEPEKYGYTFTNKTQESFKGAAICRDGWTNNVGLTQDKAKALNKMLRLKDRSSRYVPDSHAWKLQQYSMGRDLADMPWTDAWKILEQGFTQYITQYKQLLQNKANIHPQRKTNEIT